MNASQVAEILALPLQERIRLVELIWDSVAAMPLAHELSPEVQADLLERLRVDEAEPDAAGYSWDDVKQRLRDGTWRSV
ncbi:conserved hypothetical protein [Thiomonas sp. X19]|uniref:addiction module protein n=1 Tax=Thiomonas sp. X19 TaxID=1050370 RepID=UPI000B721373|nr:addiction module protein [Thiomonas sp. X19]SCC95756.1 conserved hypothetical protein [Thiomonas sp. X19]